MSTRREPCRIIVYHNNLDTFGVRGRRTVWRKVNYIGQLFEKQIAMGTIRANNRITTVYRHPADSLWTSFLEEATGMLYERIALPDEDATDLPPL